MPSSSERERMIDFEGALASGTEARGSGLLALSLTGAGQKEWRFYCQSPQVFMDSLQRDLQGKEQFPIDLQLFHDPEWSGVSEFL
jgi:hypothetical protein